jgi:hypothetical protein
VRNTRDGLEHHHNDKVITRDFELQPNGQIARPTIEIRFRDSVQERVQIAGFMQQVWNLMLICFQMFNAHTCLKNTRPFGGLPMTVGLLSNEFQDSWRVQYAYGMVDKDSRFIPCG